MSDSYVGEIRMFGGNFAPVDWAFCNGQLLSIAENAALFQLLGTAYGGDGVNTFGLPNLPGRLPVDQGSGYGMGQLAGNETVTLTSNQIPAHSHSFAATGAGGPASPAGALPASGNTIYSASAPTAVMSPQSIAAAGGNQPHDNMMPYLAVSFIISLYGIFPSQN